MQPFYPPKCCDVRLGCALCATHSKLLGFSRLRENEALLVTHGAKSVRFLIKISACRLNCTQLSEIRHAVSPNTESFCLQLNNSRTRKPK